MTLLRAKVANFALSEQSPFCRTFCYWADHPLKEMLAEGYFLTVASSLMAGDRIKAVQITNNDPRQGRVLAYAELQVVAVSTEERTIDVRPLQIADFPEQKAPEPEPEEKAPAFTPADGEVKWNPGKKRHEVVAMGSVVGWSKDKAEAEAMARGDVPLNAEAA